MNHLCTFVQGRWDSRFIFLATSALVCISKSWLRHIQHTRRTEPARLGKTGFRAFLLMLIIKRRHCSPQDSPPHFVHVVESNIRAPILSQCITLSLLWHPQSLRSPLHQFLPVLYEIIIHHFHRIKSNRIDRLQSSKRRTSRAPVLVFPTTIARICQAASTFP